jgi:hypothetical protein
MNEAMKQAWLEITQMMGVTTPEELDVFLRAWQRAIQAEREECAKVCDELRGINWGPEQCAAAIRARGQA